MFETNLGDICLVAAARAIHKDILIFNTNKIISISTMTIICADQYDGGIKTDNNPILMAYNAVNSETLEKVSVSTTFGQSRWVSVSTTSKFLSLDESRSRQL